MDDQKIWFKINGTWVLGDKSIRNRRVSDRRQTPDRRQKRERRKHDRRLL